MKWAYAFILVVLPGGGVAACAHVPAAQGRASANVITEDEIARTHAPTALEAIRLLRPGFLVSRGPTSLRVADAGFPNVYVDDVAYGAFSTLNEIRAEDVAMIRLYRAGEATYRFGTGNPGGVIEIFTKH